MAASLPGYFNVQAFSDAGAVAASYRLYTYAAGTTTHKAAYTDAAGTTPHTYVSDGIGGLYIALNARGELPAPLFLASGAYDVALKTSAGATVWTRYADGTDQTSTLSAALALGFSVNGSNELVATTRVVSPRFEGTNTDDTGTPDAVFRANRVLSAGVLDGHGFRDQTTFSRVANSYASFDAALVSSGAGTNDHIAGFQSRPVVSRSGGALTHVYNFVSSPTFNTGNATNNYGLFCFNPVGGGTVDYNYALYVPNQTKGTLGNWAIYVAQGGHRVFLGADTQINQLLRVGSAQYIIGGATTSDYPFAGYNYEPTTATYQAADVAVTTKFDTTGLRVYGAAAGSAGAACTLTELMRVKLTGSVNFPPRTTPTSPAAGDVYYDSGTNKLRCYNGSAWNDLF
jgi:hypothetical protein